MTATTARQTGREADQDVTITLDGQPVDEGLDREFEEEEPGLVEQIRRIRLRHQLVPYPVIAALWAGAAAAHQHPFGAPIAMGAALVVAVVWWVAWDRTNRISRREQRRWTTTVVLAGTAWLG